jgi:hypothetical protein
MEVMELNDVLKRSLRTCPKIVIGIAVIDLCYVKFDQKRWFFCDYEI